MLKQIPAAVTAVFFGVLTHAGLCWSVQGAAYYFPLGDVFSGSPPTSTTEPWVSALIEDVSPGTVRLTIENVNLTAEENVNEIYFNLNPALVPGDLTFNLYGSSGLFDLPVINTGVDLFKADGDGRYDIKLVFANGGMGTNRFGAGELLSYDIGGVAGLTAMDFVHLSLPDGGNGPFYAAAHVQRIGPLAGDSGWINPTDNQVLLVPEPAAAGLWLIGVGLWVSLQRLRRANPA